MIICSDCGHKLLKCNLEGWHHNWEKDGRCAKKEYDEEMNRWYRCECPLPSPKK